MNEFISEDRRARIKARYEAATKGPWIYHPEDVVITANGDENAPQGDYIAVQGADATDDDMDFIAHSRDDIPDLFNENTILRDQNARLRAEFDRASRMTQTEFMRWRETVDAARVVCTDQGADDAQV